MDINDVVNTAKAAKEAGLAIEKYTNNTLEKPTHELGEGLADIFWLIFSPFKAARATLEPKIENLKNKIAKEVEKIPAENLVEPPLNIIGPALEASKFYIEDDTISSMFARLISSSMDITTQGESHPAFIEVIKQLSVFDAKIMKYLFENRGNFGVLSIELNTKTPENPRNGTATVGTNLFPFPEMNFHNYSKYSAALDNLLRLKIIEIDFDRYFLEDYRYEPFESHPYFDFLRLAAKNSKTSDGSEFLSIEDRKGVWGFTSFGFNFAHCCLV